MKNPSEYVDVLDDFLANGAKGVKFEKASREDAACLTMVVFLKELPVEVRLRGREVYLLRKT